MRRGGAVGYLDQQLFKKYALPIMTTTLTSLSSYYMAPKEESDGEVETPRQEAANDARQNFLNDMNQIFENILQDKANIKPMTYIPAGTRIIIYPNVDLWLRTVERDSEESSNDVYKDVLIDDEAKSRERANSRGAQAAGTVGGPGGSSSVVYEADDSGAQATGTPLISDQKYSNNPQPQTVAPPPPPLVSSQPATTSRTPAPAPRPSGGSTSSGTDSSVPQLF